MVGRTKWATATKGAVKPRAGRSESSASAAASAIYTGGTRPRSTTVGGRKQATVKVDPAASTSSSGNGNSSGPSPASVVHWFDLDSHPDLLVLDDPQRNGEIEGTPTVPVPTLLPGLSETEIAASIDEQEIGDSPSLSIVDLDMAVDDDLQPIDQSDPEAFVPRSQSEFDLRHWLGLDESATIASQGSDIHLIDFTAHRTFPESVSTVPSVHDLELTSSAKTTPSSRTQGKSVRKPWPGRYKVKVLENIPKKRVKKAQPIDSNSPYKGEAFIDVDGQLKLGGKSFETYITHPQYRLLKDIYAPGMIASRVPLPRSRSRDSSNGQRSSTPSRSPANKSPSQAPLPQNHSKVEGQSSISSRLTTRNSEQQTEVQGFENIGMQTEESTEQRRRTVDFDLERTTIQDYEPDYDDDSSSVRFWNTGDDSDSEVASDDMEEELLWDNQMTTAVQMVAAILSAQKAGSESLESPIVVRALDNLDPEELREVMDLVNYSSSGQPQSWTTDDGDELEDDSVMAGKHTEALHRLMDLYSSAHNYILGHLRATDAYEAKFPLGRRRIVGGGSRDQEPKILPIETVNANIVERKEAGVDEAVSVCLLEGGSPVQHNYLRYSPEISLDQFRVHLQARPDRITQNIQVHDTSFGMIYGVNGASTILSATRSKDSLIPISTGNLLLMHNQHASLLASRIISSKFYLNRVVHQLMSLGELFLIGKFAKLSHVDTLTISSKLYHRLRELNVFSGIIFQLSSHFVSACTKILGSLSHLAKFEPFRPPQSLTVIGEPVMANVTEFTVPTNGVLRADDAFGPLLAAFDEIDSIIITGSTSLQALNQGGGVKVRGKYYKMIVTCMEGAKQLERGRELDFGAILIGYLVDLMLLQRLEGKPGEGALDSKQIGHLWTNYHDLQVLLRELIKLGKKATLLSSFASVKTMAGLRKFRYAQNRADFGCFLVMLERFRRKKVEGRDGQEGVEDKEAIEDLTQEIDTLEQDKSRLIQMLRAISNESSLSFSIF